MFRVQSMELATGVRLPYVEHGDPAGLPVVFLHGVTDSWRSFELVLPQLPPAIRAVALTQRGHGDAGRPATGYRPHDFAADVAALLDALEIDSAVIVGHSMGSSIAQRFALDHPHRTAGLVLVGAFIRWQASAAVREFWDTVVSQLADPIAPALAREFQQSTLAQPVPPAFFETAVRETLKVPARVWQAVFGRFLAEDVSAELAAIAAPTLIVWGDRDALCAAEEQATLAATIPGAELLVYRDTGHAVHWERPERFAADLLAWTERVIGAPANA
jgi:pimeloyl-ACP methyl ester carboxylesterase